MTEQEFYYTIEKEAIAEFKDRGSKFIGYACPIKSVDEFKDRLNEIKKEHPRATHRLFRLPAGSGRKCVPGER
ncbi:YigZ family protein [Puia sp. P3]|uniref:YigZ family protein n=1 Tax=Puia sp. P3 TaxID=3423952 RepID=UPI003D67DC26